MRFQNLIGNPTQPLEAVGSELSQRLGDFDVATCDIDDSCRNPPHCQERTRRWCVLGIFRSSRYFVMLRRVTEMPSSFNI